MLTGTLVVPFQPGCRRYHTFLAKEDVQGSQPVDAEGIAVSYSESEFQNPK
jgi:hypothetical protein